MIKSLRLQNFRSYDDKTFELKSGSNVLVGANGAGKTNALEAIYVTLKGKSWRASDEALLNDGAEWARVDIQDENDDIYTFIIDNRGDSFKKIRKINDQAKRVGYPPLVLFEPDFILTLTGSPTKRRAWLDDILSQESYIYKNALNQYNRALRQRNSLLKKDHVSQDHIFVWNLKLAEFGEVVSGMRREFINSIKEDFQRIYKSISDQDDQIHIAYQQSFSGDYVQEFINNLEKNFDRDRLVGFTSRGPHREDFVISYYGEASTDRMSRGEFRTAAITLKQIEYNYLEKLQGATPVLLLDDILSELDKTRANRMGILNKEQTIATTTDATKTKAEITINI